MPFTLILCLRPIVLLLLSCSNGEVAGVDEKTRKVKATGGVQIMVGGLGGGKKKKAPVPVPTAKS